MKQLIIVGLGGFIGSILRFKIGAIFLHQVPDSRFPWATLTVNIFGCFLVGLIAAGLERVSFYNAEMRLLLITGLLGGFTTFSAFGLETLYLLRTGENLMAFANILTSLILGLIAVWAGLFVMGRISG